MVNILITAGIFLLILVSLFLVLVVLMQRANSDGGLGTAFGSGITESAFGTDAGNVMTKITKVTFVIFFILAFALYLGMIAQHSGGKSDQKSESLFAAEAAAEQAAAPAEATDTAAPSPDQDAPAASDVPAAPAPAAPAE